jgi:hypothetical protein
MVSSMGHGGMTLRMLRTPRLKAYSGCYANRPPIDRYRIAGWLRTFRVVEWLGTQTRHRRKRNQRYLIANRLYRRNTPGSTLDVSGRVVQIATGGCDIAVAKRGLNLGERSTTVDGMRDDACCSGHSQGP